MNNMIPAVEHTIAVLEYMSSTDSGVTQSEIRQKLQISMSSAYRILPGAMSLITEYCRRHITVTAICRYLNMRKGSLAELNAVVM